MLVWRNHPETRRFFFNPDLIDMETHRKWFSTSLVSPTRHMLVAEDDRGESIGIVRFDVIGERAEVDIYLVPKHRGTGLGVPMLTAAIEWLKENTEVKRLSADVVPANQSSLRMFAAVGFGIVSQRLILELA